jgi:hypothetical protein
MPRKPRPRPAQPQRALPTTEDPPVFPPDIMAKRFPGGFTVRDEANAIVAYAFRNGPLEDLHAGTWSELLNDKSLTRITDQEMKELMLFACEHVERILRLKESDPQEYDLFVKSYNFRYCRQWER